MNVRDTMPMADLKGMMVGKDALGPDAAKRPVVTRTFEVVPRPGSRGALRSQLPTTPEEFSEERERASMSVSTWRQERLDERIPTLPTRTTMSAPVFAKPPSADAATQYPAAEAEDHRSVRTLETRRSVNTAPTLDTTAYSGSAWASGTFGHVIPRPGSVGSGSITRPGSVGSGASSRRRRHQKHPLDPVPRRAARSKRELLPLAELGGAATVHGWCVSYVDESRSWNSLSLWAESRIDEADTLSPGPKPNKPRTVILVDVFRRVSSLFGRFQPVMKLILKEMLTAIYWDAAEVEDPSDWGDEDLYARLTFFEHNVHMRNQVESYRALILEDEDEDDVLTQFKHKSGKAFKAMLNPEVRLVRGMIFRAWAGHVRQCVVLRQRVAHMMILRLMYGLKRRCFAALIYYTKTERELKLRIVKENVDPFEAFAHQHRHYVGALVGVLEERAPGFFRGPVNSPGGLLKEVARLIYKGDIPDWVDKKQILKELRIFDEVKQVEQKECPICAERRWRTERARSIGTQTVDGDEKEAKKKKKKKPAEHKVAPLAVDTVMTLIGEIYDSVVVQENKVYGAKLQGVPYTQLTLHELVRDFLIRKYGIRTLANKNFQGLVNCIADTAGNERIDTFSLLFADAGKQGGAGGEIKVQRRKSFVPGGRRRTEARGTPTIRGPPVDAKKKEKDDDDADDPSKYNDELFQMFSFLLATIHSLTKDVVPKISITFNSKEKQVLKVAFVTAARATLAKTVAAEDPAWDRFMRDLDRLPAQAPPGISNKMRKEKETITVDSAITLIMPLLKQELEGKNEEKQMSKAARMIQKAWRQRMQRIEFASTNKAAWARVFERVDVKMHPHPEHRNCFTYDEFCMLVELGCKRHQSEELVMILFNDWHTRCDDMLLDELDERRDFAIAKHIVNLHQVNFHEPSSPDDLP